MLVTKARAGFLVAALMMNLLLASTLNVREAHACSCAASPIQDEIQRSDAVFSGKVQSIDEEMTSADGKQAPGRVTIDVHESWKGVSTEPVDVYGQGDGVNCYIVFEKGEIYLVYASRTEEKGDASLENNECGATKPLADAKEDLQALGSPTGELPQTGGLTPSVLLRGFATGAGLLIAGTFLLRRSGRKL